MTIYHKHHIIPRYMGGTNDPSNLVEVTIDQHAALHKQLWQDLGHWQDHIAWRMLSGQITSQEATIEAIKMAQTGRKQSPETIEKKRLKRIGTKHSEETRKKISLNNKGKKHSEETKRKIGKHHKGKALSDKHKKAISETHLGKKKTPEQRQKMSESAKKLWEKRALEKGELSPR